MTTLATRSLSATFLKSSSVTTASNALMRMAAASLSHNFLRRIETGRMMRAGEALSACYKLYQLRGGATPRRARRREADRSIARSRLMRKGPIAQHSRSVQGRLRRARSRLTDLRSPWVSCQPTHNLVFVDHDAVRPFNSEDIVALPQPVSRERKGNFLAWKGPRPRLCAFVTRVYGDNHPCLLDHCLTLSPAA